ncbi:alpha/beta fold hydrolase [Idiomarina xiamenensis]|uniref:Alpha/beta hydrolase n=1 Tax=Idiomarina xiamenensis 10-D-4 TaxID=740709 RepID=K2JHS0_9GAMM|nr:alpha/beta hydrolase [Idiomarina xiamenensis]EKE82931.1 alpha/beta hydrolase [Idiomarina xiamenensis 10-D-4]
MRYIVLTLACIGGLFTVFVSQPTVADTGNNDKPVYDATLTQFDYPFSVEYFTFDSQQQSLDMAYMLLEGNNQKPPILLLHGKNFSGAYWETTARWLHERGYTVIIPDQIGFGKSSKPVHYQFTFSGLADNTKRLLNHLNINKVMVVGHSMGGMLASRFALNYPSASEKLILINPIGLENYLAHVHYKPIEFFYQKELAAKPDSVKQYQQKNYYDGKWADRYQPWVDMQAGWINGPDWERVAWNNALTYDMVFTQPVITEFDRLQTPTALIIGTRDTTGPGRGWQRQDSDYQLGQYDQLGKIAADKLPNAKLYELSDLGHLPQIEDFERFIDVFEQSIMNIEKP